MAQPNIASVKIDGDEFNAIGVHFGISTMNNGHAGMPVMGGTACAVAVVVNLNDQINMPFALLNTLFTLASGVTREKIKVVVLTFWADDSKTDVICTYTFNGWISQYVTATGASKGSQEGDATNHVLTLTIQPELDASNFVKIALGN